MPAPTLLTELELINDMLSIVGTAPVTSLVAPYSPDVAVAKAILTKNLRKFLQKGWHFNSQVNVILVKDINGNIYLGSNVARVDGYSYGLDIAQHGNRVFDVRNKTYTFTANITVTQVLYYSFEELPEPARLYLQAQCAHEFQIKRLGAQALQVFTKEDVVESWSDWLQYDQEMGDYNTFNADILSDILDRERDLP